MFVGRRAGLVPPTNIPLDYSDARPSYFNLFTEPRTPRRMFESIGPGYAIGEQQSKRTQSGVQQFKRTQSGSSISSGHNRGAAVKADAIGRRAAAEAGAIGEQQLRGREAEANGERSSASSSGSGWRNRAREQQLKRMQAASSS